VDGLGFCPRGAHHAEADRLGVAADRLSKPGRAWLAFIPEDQATDLRSPAAGALLSARRLSTRTAKGNAESRPSLSS
jgi:hypothetical protein